MIKKRAAELVSGDVLSEVFWNNKPAQVQHVHPNINAAGQVRIGFGISGISFLYGYYNPDSEVEVLEASAEPQTATDILITPADIPRIISPVLDAALFWKHCGMSGAKGTTSCRDLFKELWATHAFKGGIQHDVAWVIFTTAWEDMVDKMIAEEALQSLYATQQQLNEAVK